jgi:hypothetical protein
MDGEASPGRSEAEDHAAAAEIGLTGLLVPDSVRLNMKEAANWSGLHSFLFDDFHQVLKFVCQSCPASRNAPKHGGSPGGNITI